MARALTIVLPFYRNPGMLDLQLDRFASYPQQLRERLDIIVVDDGSPKEVAEAPTVPQLCNLEPAKIRMFRIDVDVRWNWIAARNIGHHHARSEWVLFTDIDHLIPKATADRLINGKLDPARIYKFSRVNYPKGDPYKPHPNSWLMTREMFDRVGGYDERFSGFYGTDGMFRDRCQSNSAKGIVQLDEVLERVDREVLKDASTRHYGRKEDQDKEAVPRIRREIEASGDHKPHRLTFPYHQFFPVHIVYKLAD